MAMQARGRVLLVEWKKEWLEGNVENEEEDEVEDVVAVEVEGER